MMIPVTSSGIGLEGAPLTEEEKKEIGEMIKRVNKKHESDN
jgi:hypothetical protein